MYKRFKRVAAILLASVMMMQSGAQGLAAEAQTQAETQALAEGQTEAQTQAPTEVQTQAPTEAQTQAPTEAQTQAPTEAQTQAPTEASTEAQTQAPTEAQTQASTEEQTEKGTEKAQEETERSGRVNNGKEMRTSAVAASLQSALPYLFAAKSVKASEALLERQEIADGEEGHRIVAGLETFSRELANAVSSVDIEVVNLYADKDGKLDTAQLDELYSNHVIDVTKKYYVVNVIADHADQVLSFSGYEMISSGKAVTYNEETQPGDILYNFVSLEKGQFKDYTGTLTLSKGSGLQGTFLAPKASVKVNSNLAGAVYADNVHVADSVRELLQIVFVNGRQIEETEAKEPDEDAVQDEPAQETEPEQTDEEAQSESTEEAEPDEGANDAKPSEEEEVIDSSTYMTDASTAYANVNAALTVRLVRTDHTTPVASGTVSVKAAEEFRNDDGTVQYAVGDTVASTNISSGAANVGASLTTPGNYYFTISNLPTGYYGMPCVYFTVGTDGAVSIANSSSSDVVRWDQASSTLTLTMYDNTATADQMKGKALLTVTKDAGLPVNGAVFVVARTNGQILPDPNQPPSYLIHYSGVPVLLSGIPAGSYTLLRTFEEAGDNLPASTPFTISQDTRTDINISSVPVVGANTLTVTAQALCNNVLLTAEAGRKTRFYAALFSDAAATTRVSAVTEIVFDANAQSSRQISFSGLAAGTYYLAATNELGEKLEASRYQVADASGAGALSSITFASGAAETKAAVLKYNYVINGTENTYPAGDFSYTATVTLTKKLLNSNGGAQTGQADDDFLVELYRDSARTQKALSAPITFHMQGVNTQQQQCQVKMTVGSADLYLAETDKNGSAIGATITGNSRYTVSYSPNNDGRVTVVCGQAVSAEIRNQINSNTVRLRLVDAKSGAYISGVTMTVKDKNGKIVHDNGKAIVFKSGVTDHVLTNVLQEGQTYYLSQVSAPSGYAPSPDVAFTVNGPETEAVMQSSAARKTNHTITVQKQVYSGEYHVYAQDDTNGTNASKGRYTFYAALFADKGRMQKVSDVQKITVKGLSGSTSFKNVEQGKTYYVSETNSYGEPLTSSNTTTIRYADGGVVKADTANRSTVIQNVYSGRPAGYRYTARLSVTMRVVKASGEAANANETFYAGIFRKADYSDTPTVIPLELRDVSSATITRRILLPNNGETTYYIAEVNADGSRINTGTFGYSVEIDKPTLKVSRGDNASVTITNRERSSKVTLYLTKKVYQGVEPKAVNQTFYAGLFKDPNFTQLYAKPIPLNLQGKSEQTLKLSLNLGTASNANIYIAEVDRNGKVIRNEEGFGYEIRVLNSTAAFTPQTREIQTILLNTVYGTVTQDEWQQILRSESSYIGGASTISGNGEVGVAAKTGDETPLMLYGALLAAAALLIILLIVFRKKRK